MVYCQLVEFDLVSIQQKCFLFHFLSVSHFVGKLTHIWVSSLQSAASIQPFVTLVSFVVGRMEFPHHTLYRLALVSTVPYPVEALGCSVITFMYSLFHYLQIIYLQELWKYGEKQQIIMLLTNSTQYNCKMICKHPSYHKQRRCSESVFCGGSFSVIWLFCYF